MKAVLYFISVTFGLLMFISCADMNTVEVAPTNEGISRVYSEDYELVKAAVLASMQSMNINIKRTNQSSEGFSIMFTKSISAFSWGEVGRVLVVDRQDAGSEVFVHSEKRLKHQFAGANEREFSIFVFNGISQILEKR